MAGRIDLNLPPRLIESARAAQYTNREVLGARALEQRIKAKARRRQEAAIRANPRLITPQQREGGQLEFQQAPLQRIWRRHRTAALSVLFISIIDENDDKSPAGWDKFTSIGEIKLDSALMQTYQPPTYEPYDLGFPAFDLFGSVDLDTALEIEDYRFVVLKPTNPGYDMLGLPVGWPLKGSTVFAYLIPVGREDFSNGLPAYSDYFTMINQVEQLSQFDFVHITVDNSGSMSTGTVRVSLELFVNKLTERKIPYLVSEMRPEEAYVKAHLFLVSEP